MTRALSVLLLLALVAPSVGGDTIIVRRESVPPTPVHFLDDFDTDSSANWAETGNWIGEVAINDASSGLFEATENTGTSIYDTPIATAAGYGCVTITDHDYNGFKFRAAADDSNRSYALRVESSVGVAWRHCTGTNCATIESASPGFQNGEHLGVVYSGVGDATTVDWFVFATGTGCPNCSASDCDTSTWAAAADDTGQFTTDPDSVDGSAGCTTWSNCVSLDTQRHVGLYSGNNTGATAYDNYYAGDD